MFWNPSIAIATLQWRHNGRDSVSNHQPHDCLLNRLFRHRSKQTSKLPVTGLCAGNSPGTGEFPAQMASYAENVSIWWRHHESLMRPSVFCWRPFIWWISVVWVSVKNGIIFRQSPGSPAAGGRLSYSSHPTLNTLGPNTTRISQLNLIIVRLTTSSVWSMAVLTDWNHFPIRVTHLPIFLSY